MRVLLGEGAAGLVGPAVSGRAALLTPRQVLFRPRRRVAVTYDAVWPDGRRDRVVAMADARHEPPDVATVRAADLPVAVWRAAGDPFLPGLGRALDPATAARLLREAGVRAAAATVALRAYRPGRRAVVEVRPDARLVIAPAGGLYLKVVRPDRAARIARLHAALARVAPVAPCAPAGSGILRLGPLTGRTLGASLRRGLPVPPPAALLDLLGRIAAVETGGACRSSDERLADHVALLRTLAPDEAGRLERLAAVFGTAAAQPRVTVHGDFHEGNLLGDDRGITGLLDVDGAGAGERVDDLGLLVGRVWALAGRRGAGYTEELLHCFDAAVDPDELRRRAGVALVGRATGPFRNQTEGWPQLTHERLDLAEEWAKRYRCADRRT